MTADAVQVSTPRRVLGCLILAVVIGAAVVVLPLLLWAHTTLNLKVIGVLLHQDDYSRATFDITEYVHSTEGAGEFMRTHHYFYGTVAGRPHTMPVTFANYSPALTAILDTQKRGRMPLSLSVEVWYNPAMASSWLAREHVVLPYTPDFFTSLYPRLAWYVFLWMAFAGIWLIMVLLPKSRLVSRRTGTRRLTLERPPVPRQRKTRSQSGSRLS